jgi:hypothetical protein
MVHVNDRTLAGNAYAWRNIQRCAMRHAETILKN